MSSPLPPAVPVSDAQPGLSGAAASGTGWTTAQSLLNKFATLLAMYVIALQLSPAEFGMAAVTLAIGKFLVVLPPMTMGDLLLSHHHRWSQYAPIGRRVVFRVALAITAGIVLLAPLFAVIYDQYPRGVLVGLIMVVALRPTGEALTVIPLSRLRLGLRYRSIAMVDGGVQLAATALTVAMAFLGAGALALVLPQIVAILVRALCYRSLASHARDYPVDGLGSPAATDSPKLLREFASVGGAQFIHSVLDTLPILILGRFASEIETGLYAFAFLFAAQANGVISFQLGIVLQPIFGRMKDDLERQAAAFLRAVSAVSAIIVPVALIQGALAQPLFLLVFDPDYEPAWPVFVALSIIEAFFFATAPTIALLKAQGRFRTYFAWQATQLAVSALVFPLAAMHWGALGVAVAGAVIWGVSLPIAVWLGTRAVRGSWRTALKVFAAPWATALPIALLVYGSWLILQPHGAVGKVIALCVIGPLGFVISIWATRISQPATYAELAPMIERVSGRVVASCRKLVSRTSGACADESGTDEKHTRG